MGDPYLSSDESLILSTHGIRTGGLSLDLMLTSRRLILIDNSVTPFQLRTIPLETIITVFAGTDAKGDPIITLSSMDISGTGAPHPLDFVFTRQKGEPRVKECNEWAATLEDQANRVRNEAITAGTLPYDPVKVLQPRMSATYRIETVSPRRSVIGEYPVKPEPLPSSAIPQSPVIDEPAPLENVKPADISTPPLLPSLPEGEETVLPGEEIPDTNEYSPIPTAADAKTNPPVPAITTGEIIDEISSEYENPPDLTPVHAVSEIPSEKNQEPEISETHQPEVPDEKDEDPAITDAKSIWADAARSLVSSSPAIPAIPVVPAPDAVPAVDNTDDEPESTADQARIIPEEPVAEINDTVIPVNTIVPASPPDDGPVELPAPGSIPETDPETAPIPAAVTSPAPESQKQSSPPILIAAIVVVILVVLGVAMIGSFHLLDSGKDLPAVVVPVATVQPTPALVPGLVPADGLWVRIEYPGTFIGEVGNLELMHPVSGSGVQLYKALWSDRVVKASAQKQDYSGDTLLIEIYRNGALIKRSSTRVPMGSVDLLIDPLTGQPPGIRRGDIP